MIANLMKTFAGLAEGISPSLTMSREARTVGSYFGDVSESLSRAGGGGRNEILSVMRGERTAADVGLNESTQKVISTVQSRFDEGTLSSNAAIGAMYRNVQDTGEVFGGLSRAGETKSQALGFGALGNPSNIIGSAAMGAVVGAGTSSIFGGDAVEGGMYGGLIGAGGSIGARVFRESLGAMEESVMKKALGDSFKTKDFVETRNIPGGGVVDMKGKRFYMDSGEIIRDNKVTKTVDTKRMQSIQSYKLNKSNTIHKVMSGGVDVKTGKVLSARNQNLEAISSMDLKDVPDSMNFLDKQVMKQMQNNKSASMGVQSRFATMSGAALAGMAFTSSAGSDKRRGFNRNRGNRI